jgi:hypothetical protein
VPSERNTSLRDIELTAEEEDDDNDGMFANMWWLFRSGGEVEGGGGAVTLSSCWSVRTEKMRLCKIFS